MTLMGIGCYSTRLGDFGPFDMNNDLQNVAVTQNFEKKASLKTGRTGGLPYVGTGWYRTSFDAPADKEVTLLLTVP